MCNKMNENHLSTIKVINIIADVSTYHVCLLYIVVIIGLSIGYFEVGRFFGEDMQLSATNV